MTSGQFIWIWWLSKGTRNLFGEEQTHKFSFISGLKCSLFASFSAPCEQSVPLSSWVRRIKAGSVWIAQSFEVAAARTFGLVNLVLSRQIVFFSFRVWASVYCETDGHNRARCSKRTAIRPTRFKTVLASCRACSRRIFRDSCRVFLEYAKIKQTKGRLCWQGAFSDPSSLVLILEIRFFLWTKFSSNWGRIL